MKVTLEKVLSYFRPKQTAALAKERLQIIIAHERLERDNPDYLIQMQHDLLDVIAKYVPINKDDIRIEIERKDNCAILELNIVLPQTEVA